MEGSLSSWPVPELAAQDQDLAAVPSGGGCDVRRPSESREPARCPVRAGAQLPPPAPAAASFLPPQAPRQPVHCSPRPEARERAEGRAAEQDALRPSR